MGAARCGVKLHLYRMTSLKVKPRRSLRHFLLLWSGAIGVAFVLLALDAGATLFRLDGEAKSSLRDTRRLQLEQEFELAALQANRRPKADWSRADAAFERLRRVEPTQGRVMQTLDAQYERLKIAFDPRNPADDETDFLDAFRTLRAAELGRSEAQTRDEEGLDRASRLSILALSALSLVGLILGGVRLWTRVFEPTLQLTEAARRFENGDLAARVPVTYPDELGELGATFNDMAGALQVREAEKLRFVASVAHDLKTPLVVVGGAAMLLRERPDRFSVEEQGEWLDRIARNARRMEAMIADLTDSVQGQTGALQLRFAPCDLAALWREAVEECAFSFPDRTVLFEGASTLTLHGDCGRLERVAANLLSNAAKYSDGGTTVVAHLERRDGWAVAEVRDGGAGISPTDLKRLFAPFVRLESTQDKASGTGLGLATVKKIVEAHGGRIEVESEVGVGSTFRVWLATDGDSQPL